MPTLDIAVASPPGQAYSESLELDPFFEYRKDSDIDREIGAIRIVDMLSGEQLPRICQLPPHHNWTQ